MKLTGLELLSSVRLSQAADYIDIELDLLNTSTTIDQTFYSMLFFDMLNGDVTGETAGAATPGFLFKIYKTDGTLFSTSAVSQLDWYETETGYVSETMPTFTVAVPTDMHVRKVEMYYVANDVDVNKEVLMLSSEEINRSNFATKDASDILGVPVLAAGGDLTASVMIKFVIAV